MAKKLATGARKAAMRKNQAATKRELIEAQEGHKISGGELASLGARHEAEEADSEPSVGRPSEDDAKGSGRRRPGREQV